MDYQAKDVIDFWVEAGPSRWFQGGIAFDEQCARFLPLHMAASRGELTDWADNAHGALALILLLDQMPRNLFRGSAHAYATDPLARTVAQQAIDANFDQAFNLDLRSFFYLPFMHSESLDDQRYCVALFEPIPEAGSAGWARHHCEIVERFGRFPHRNTLLGRSSTPEEQAWLEKGGFQG